MTWSNARRAASAAERMRGCVFAENLVSEYRVELNAGTVNGTGTTIARSATFDGNGYLEFTPVGVSDFSAVVQFSADALLSGDGIIFGNQDLTGGSPASGFCIWADADGIKAAHSTGAACSSEVAVDVDYSDGETHTITYVVGLTGGAHTLYVGTSSDTDTTALAGPLGASANLLIGGDGTTNFEGTVEKVRLFNTDLDEAEHDVYVGDTLESFYCDSTAIFRCDEICDRDTLIWDRMCQMNDLTKGDGAGSGEPTFVDDAGGYYEFDGADDYVSGWPTLADEYTIAYVLSSAYPGEPYSQQENDETTKALMEVGGDFTGLLHSMVIYPIALTTIQGYQDKYKQLYYTERGPVEGFALRLVNEGVCNWAGAFEQASGTYTDWSDTGADGTDTLVTKYTLSGGYVTFESATSNITVSDEAALRSDELTIIATGWFDGFAGASHVADKGANFELQVGASSITLNASTISHTWNENTQLAVVAKDGYKPRFFVDGELLGEGSATVTLDDTDTTDLVIGNNNALASSFDGALKRFLLVNTALTDDEIRAHYNGSAKTAIAL